MFQFRRFPSCTYGFSTRYTSFTCVDCSIRKSTYRCPLTAPRGLSQFVASFFGSQCQGIPLALFVAWPCVLLGSFKTRLLQRLALWNCRFRFKILVFEYFRISSLYLLSLYSVFNVHRNKILTDLVLLSLTAVKLFRLISQALVEMNGIEPMTPCLQSRCSPSWATPPYSLSNTRLYLAVLAHILLRFLFTGPSKLNNDCKNELRNWPWMLNQSVSSD